MDLGVSVIGIVNFNFSIPYFVFTTKSHANNKDKCFKSSVLKAKQQVWHQKSPKNTEKIKKYI